MDDEVEERVLAVVAAIPPGKVLSYAEVADRAGLRSARLVGRILAGLPPGNHGIPWHRVVRADGSPTPHLAERQTELLRGEGVRFVHGRVSG